MVGFEQEKFHQCNLDQPMILLKRCLEKPGYKFFWSLEFEDTKERSISN